MHNHDSCINVNDVRGAHNVACHFIIFMVRAVHQNCIMKIDLQVFGAANIKAFVFTVYVVSLLRYMSPRITENAICYIKIIIRTLC